MFQDCTYCCSVNTSFHKTMNLCTICTMIHTQVYLQRRRARTSTPPPPEPTDNVCAAHKEEAKRNLKQSPLRNHNWYFM